MLLQFLINVVELIIIVKIAYKVGKYFVRKWLFGKKSKRKGFSAFSKIKYMISKRIHAKLNSMMKAQKESLASQQQDSQSNVINFKNHQSKKVN